MSSRDLILNSIARTSAVVLPPDFPVAKVTWENRLVKFADVLRSIGGVVIETQSYSGIREYVYQTFEGSQRVVSTIPLDRGSAPETSMLHEYDNVEVTVIRGEFGVAENGSVWITERSVTDRVLPFICQHLIVVLNKYDLVNTMQDAYNRIGDSIYDFGTFIAGPSKTADIEQSLVLGAHGPKSMTVFLVENTPD
jgi:L-lactate dehydrogenase complex protein LldG